MASIRHRASDDRILNLKLKGMSPEERVNLALELTSSITSITLDSIRYENPHISTRELLEMARHRIQRGRSVR